MMESLPQQIRATDLSRSAKSIFTSSSVPVSPSKKLEIRDSLSWALCFAIIAGITGALLIYKIGVTMFAITSILFYLSLAGLVFFIVKMIRLKSGRRIAGAASPHLN